MTACTVRTIKALVGLTSQPSFVAVKYAFEQAPLPHEPVMNVERWGVAQKEDRLIVVDPRNTFDAVYLCQHCGSTYMEDPEEPV